MGHFSCYFSVLFEMYANTLISGFACAQKNELLNCLSRTVCQLPSSRSFESFSDGFDTIFGLHSSVFELFSDCFGVFSGLFCKALARFLRFFGTSSWLRLSIFRRCCNRCRSPPAPCPRLKKKSKVAFFSRDGNNSLPGSLLTQST